MTWNWQYKDAEGAAVEAADAPGSPRHGSQADAESWLGENWRELRESGVVKVSLLDGDSVVYTMSLSEQ